MKKFSSLYLAMILILLSIAISCKKDDKKKTSPAIVKYEVICSPGGFSLTYMNANGSTTQKDIIGDNSVDYIENVNSGSVVSIVAQAKNKNAEITAIITSVYEGLIDRETIKGDYAVVTASGSIK